MRGHRGPLSAAAFAPDGRLIVTAGTDGTVRTYACDLCGTVDDLVRLATLRLASTRRSFTAVERRLYLHED